jgi:hypothetical protein
MKRKSKSLYLYLDGKKHCNVLDWALAAGVDLSEARKQLAGMYARFAVEFKVE